MGACRVCRTQLSQSFVDLGLSPLANSYVPAEARDRGEVFHPLHAFVCTNCFLVQLAEFESPAAIFSDYAYFSSYSSDWLRHAERYAGEITQRLGLGPQSRVVEIASNDGYLLQYFIARGVPVLGVEPAANVAAVARAKGIPTEVLFFGEATARQLRAAGPPADLMVANNVLAHVPDILDFVTGFAVMLAPEGAATFEFPHLLRQMRGLQFDQIYHEHFSYLSLLVVRDVMRRCGLRVFDVEELPTHGGSLRVFVTHAGATHVETEGVARVIADERAALLDRLEGYTGFGAAARDVRFGALEFFIAAARANKRVCAYGAAAKGNTFLNYVGLRADFIEAVADRSPHKQGTLLPGSRIPVVSPEAITALRPDYLLILPWNLRPEIARDMAHIKQWGGRFVTAIPSIEVF
jgi:2-polyprenyl-3-methyl-5-hydroxy-6-metoxy-1,4-benzoquinol methylase